MYSVIVDPARNQAYSGSMDHTVRVWDLSNGSCKHVLSKHGSLVAILSISPSFLVSGAADGLVCVWNPDSGDLVQTFEHKGAITCLRHDDSKVVSGSEGLVRVLDTRNGGVVRDLLSNEASIVSHVAFVGQLCVAVTRDDTTSIDVWNFSEGEKRGKQEDDGSAIE